MSISVARRQTIADLLRRSARRVPGRTAVVCADVSWSYAALDAIVDRVARGLRGIGVGVGDKVAILARNSHAFIAMRFAIARAGAVLVPPLPAFYHRPKTLEDIIDQSVNKALDQFDLGVELNLFKRWTGNEEREKAKSS